jgi:hypothetical protein
MFQYALDKRTDRTQSQSGSDGRKRKPYPYFQKLNIIYLTANHFAYWHN